MIHHLFISHSWAHNDAYERLVSLLDKSDLQFRDYSVPRDDPIHQTGTDAELRNAIREQMAHSSVVIILAGIYASYSTWINQEISLAKSGFVVPKPIIAIEPFGSQRTSIAVKKAADRIVRWSTKSIVCAIRELT